VFVTGGWVAVMTMNCVTGVLFSTGRVSGGVSGEVVPQAARRIAVKIKRDGMMWYFFIVAFVLTRN
jgi:hypothetical protein